MSRSGYWWYNDWDYYISHFEINKRSLSCKCSNSRNESFDHSGHKFRHAERNSSHAKINCFGHFCSIFCKSKHQLLYRSLFRTLCCSCRRSRQRERRSWHGFDISDQPDIGSLSVFWHTNLQQNNGQAYLVQPFRRLGNWSICTHLTNTFLLITLSIIFLHIAQTFYAY